MIAIYFYRKYAVPLQFFFAKYRAEVQATLRKDMVVERFVYCKLVIIRHVPIFAIFVSALNDEFTYWRIYLPLTVWKQLLNNSLWRKVLSCML